MNSSLLCSLIGIVCIYKWIFNEKLKRADGYFENMRQSKICAKVENY